MTYKPLHCWDCGTQVITGTQGQFVLSETFQQVRFRLADGSYCESPFCQSCAEKGWTLARVKEFEAAVNRVHPMHQIIVVAVEGQTRPSDPILAVLDPVQAIRGHRG